MHILLTTQVFPPERHPTGIVVQELAEEMAHRGWQVTVATGFPQHSYGRLYPGYQRKFVATESHNGYRVVRGWHLLQAKPSLLHQALGMASQAAAFFIAALRSAPPQVVIAGPPPILGPLVSSLIAKRYGAKLVPFIYDIYPDIAVELGVLRNSSAITAARGLERLMYRLSDRVVVLSEGFRRILVEQKGVEPQKVAVVPVWLDGSQVVPLPRQNPWRKEMGIPPDKFVVLYAGTIGLVSGAEVVVDAARRLASFPDILLVMVGTGLAKDLVQARAAALGLTNLLFLPFQPRERLSEVQASADVSLVTLAPGRGRTSLPSKVLGYMAAARPVIASVDGDSDLAKLITWSRCGFVVPPGQGEKLAETIIHCWRHPDQGRGLGEAGRRYFLRQFEKKVVIGKFAALIEQLQEPQFQPTQPKALISRRGPCFGKPRRTSSGSGTMSG